MKNRLFLTGARRRKGRGTIKWREDKGRIDPVLLDLVALRTAQIYRHTVSMERHTLDLKTRGEPEQRLAQLETWRKSSLFGKKERAALALCEAVALHPTEHVASDLLHRVRLYFSKEQVFTLTQAIIALIDWNHLSASCLWEDEPAGMRTTLHRIE